MDCMSVLEKKIHLQRTRRPSTKAPRPELVLQEEPALEDDLSSFYVCPIIRMGEILGEKGLRLVEVYSLQVMLAIPACG